MNKTWKKKWLGALRSGKYKQGEGQLRRRDNTFCCLGVLCHITAPKDAWWEDGIICYDEQYVLPEMVLDEVQLNDTDPIVPVTAKEGRQIIGALNNNGPAVDMVKVSGRAPLSALNDAGFSFKQIARKIERYL